MSLMFDAIGSGRPVGDPSREIDARALAADAEETGWIVAARIVVSCVVSGFLFAFVGVWQGAAWLAGVLVLEGLLWVQRAKAGEKPRDGNAAATGVFAISLCWVVHALLLWQQPHEVARIATLMDLFTVSLYGAITGRKDWRTLVALMAPPLLTLSLILLHLLWTEASLPVAVIASLATLGACGLIVAIALAMYYSDRALTNAYAAIERERDSLEQRVAARTAELARAMQDAQAANVAKSQFLATMSHELRTPLNAIIGYAEILQEESRDEANGGARDAARIESAGRHLLSMINDVLDLSKIDAGKMEVERRETDVASLLARVAATVQHIAKAGDTTLNVHVGAGAQTVTTDGRRLFQCVVNLAANACKFTRNGRIDIVAHVDGAHLEITVRDTGCGMDPAQIPRLFEPFVQLDSGLTRAHEGSGLGLAISRRLARLLGGDIDITSAVGVGTTARLTVPLTA